ncbi:MAG: hypothetical protein QOJ86_3700 [Bradyrhizobium sp.]|jgi:hypothetical protein|nr:hypothetical protein [Bradyrhizobium sp.]
MKRAALLGLTLLAGMSAASADEEAVFRGAGTFTCGKFASEYLKTPELTEGIYFSWALGFMTAMNVQAATGIEGRAKTFQNMGESIQSYKSSIRMYCNAHPLALYMDAVIDLYHSLETRQMPEPKKRTPR